MDEPVAVPQEVGRSLALMALGQRLSDDQIIKLVSENLR